MAQSAEQYRLNTYMSIETMNVIKKKKGNVHILTQLGDVAQAQTTTYIYKCIYI